MAGLVPFNRNTDLSMHSIYNMLDDFWNDTWFPRRSLMNDTFKVDVKENEQTYTIEAELPGVKKEEIALNIADDHLTIAVNRSEQIDESDDKFIHRERRYTSMSRSVYLSGANREAVKAKLEDGVLRIDIPKAPKASSQSRIEIE